MSHAVSAHRTKDPDIALVTTYLVKAFNSVIRAAMIAVVKECAPALLPLVLRSHGAESALRIVSAAEGTMLLSSQTDMRPGGPLRPLHALVLHGPLQRAAVVGLNVTVAGFSGDVHLAGRVGPVANTFPCFTVAPRGGSSQQCTTMVSTWCQLMQIRAELNADNCEASQQMDVVPNLLSALGLLCSSL